MLYYYLFDHLWQFHCTLSENLLEVWPTEPTIDAIININ